MTGSRIFSKIGQYFLLCIYLFIYLFPYTEFLIAIYDLNVFRRNSSALEERRNSIREKLARKERKREKKRRRLLREGNSLPPELPQIPRGNMAETEAINGGAETQLPSEQAIAFEEEERKEEEEWKKAREPPIIYKDVVDVCDFCFVLFCLVFKFLAQASS